MFEGPTNSPSEKKIIEILISDWLTSLGREQSIDYKRYVAISV